MQKSITITFISLLILFSGISATGQAPMGTRLIGMHPTETANNNYDSAIYYTQKACVGVINMLVTWNTAETAPMKYNDTLFDIANIYYPQKGLQVSLNIAPINTNVLCVPTDLQKLSFSDTVMIHRFEHFVDTMFLHIPSLSLYCLNIGNESDIYFGSDTVVWNQYSVFYDSVKTYIKKQHPNLNIGTTLTWGGLTTTNSVLNTHAHNLNKVSDIISTTYYGIDSLFHVKPPANIPNDFASLVNEYPSTSIYYQECGYPTSDTCNSNDSLQSVFVFYVFNTWDVYKTQIPFISFLNLTDLSYANVDSLASYYNFNNPTWLEYLRTLGLRTYTGNGTSKTAYNMLCYQAAIRNACSATGVMQYNNLATLNIYPIPATHYVTIELSDEYSNTRIVQVYSITGTDVINKSFVGNVTTLDISGLAKGIYFIKVNDIHSGYAYRKEFVVQ